MKKLTDRQIATELGIIDKIDSDNALYRGEFSRRDFDTLRQISEDRYLGSVGDLFAWDRLEENEEEETVTHYMHPSIQWLEDQPEFKLESDLPDREYRNDNDEYWVSEYESRMKWYWGNTDRIKSLLPSPNDKAGWASVMVGLQKHARQLDIKTEVRREIYRLTEDLLTYGRVSVFKSSKNFHVDITAGESPNEVTGSCVSPNSGGLRNAIDNAVEATRINITKRMDSILCTFYAPPKRRRKVNS